MLVHIGAGMPRLCSAEDLDALSVGVEASSADWEGLASTLRSAAAGDVADGHVWLDISWLRAASGDPGQAWQDRFARMLGYAGDHGWLSPDGRRVRAHVDWGVSR
ncbi:hypothetical protein E1218_09010 [Kribbella turkmenica]|uniref:Uncharacterized protein n=1 Tax=Kribbella turkmenica TaxID=2530375 RepID=A0A4R4XBB2_9ACTN|nr:hypothetical protein [Kribbella turkmenica]TDD27918.1 hypothetical protein E1218_09010 [Kribbella turkmenica]